MSLAAAGPAGEHDRPAGEVVRRHALGVAEVARHDAQVPVLDAGVEAHAVAPVAERGVERGDDQVALLAGDVAGGEVDHRVDRASSDGDEVAAVRDLVGREVDAHRRGLDRRATGVVLGGVVPEDREVADVAARRQALRDDLGRGRPRRCAARPRQVRHARRFERRAAVELGERLVGAAVGDEHDVLHRAHGTRGRGACPRPYRAVLMSHGLAIGCVLALVVVVGVAAVSHAAAAATPSLRLTTRSPTSAA